MERLAVGNIITGTATYVLQWIEVCMVIYWFDGPFAQYATLSNRTVSTSVLLWVTGILFLMYARVNHICQSSAPHLTESFRNFTRTALIVVFIASGTGIVGFVGEYQLSRQLACGNNGASGTFRLVINVMIGSMWLGNGILSTIGSVVLLIQTFCEQQRAAIGENGQRIVMVTAYREADTEAFCTIDDINTGQDFDATRIKEEGECRRERVCRYSTSTENHESGEVHLQDEDATETLSILPKPA